MTREGSKLLEHTNRFGPEGPYRSMIDDEFIEDWILVDCRTTMPKKQHPSRSSVHFRFKTLLTNAVAMSKLIHAVFDMEMFIVKVLDNNLTALNVFYLTENS